jgi:hypothetical protein
MSRKSLKLIVFFKKIGDESIPYFYRLSLPSPRKSEQHGDFSEFTAVASQAEV